MTRLIRTDRPLTFLISGKRQEAITMINFDLFTVVRCSGCYHPQRIQMAFVPLANVLFFSFRDGNKKRYKRMSGLDFYRRHQPSSIPQRPQVISQGKISLYWIITILQ